MVIYTVVQTKPSFVSRRVATYSLPEEANKHLEDLNNLSATRAGMQKYGVIEETVKVKYTKPL